MINYEKGPNKSRYSWDPLTTMVAVRGAVAVFTAECDTAAGGQRDCHGYNQIKPDGADAGANAWVKGPDTNQVRSSRGTQSDTVVHSAFTGNLLF